MTGMDEKNGRLGEQNGRAIWGRSPFMYPGHCSPQISLMEQTEEMAAVLHM